MNKAKEILELEKQWQELDKGVLAENMKAILYHNGNTNYQEYIKTLQEITESKKNTVEAWMNNGRKNVKIPFLKICMFAAYYELDIYDLLIDYSDIDMGMEDKDMFYHNIVVKIKEDN